MDVSSNRLFRFSKPEWLNNSAVRNTGVYTSGALVSPNPTRPGRSAIPQTPGPDPTNIVRLSLEVRSRILLPNRRRIILS